jgi:3-oxo-4-pregnene-20-carboxyl-CoA dehydrogenase alpha subunit
VNIDLSEEALAYGASARAAMEGTAPGGDLWPAVLDKLGAWDLDPLADADDLEAAAALCRAAGYCDVTYPVAERLAGAPAVAELATGPGGRADALALTLPCWTLLGMLDRAIGLAVAHVKVREQFGQPLSAFQGVQFQLTEAEVERAGLDILAKYALWSVQAGNREAVDDALALRMAALEAAEVTFRVAHQLHGAMGFCDESPLSWLSRHSQPLRRQPLGLIATRALLTRRIGRHGLTGLFSQKAGRGPHSE